MGVSGGRRARLDSSSTSLSSVGNVPFHCVEEVGCVRAERSQAVGDQTRRRPLIDLFHKFSSENLRFRLRRGSRLRTCRALAGCWNRIFSTGEADWAK